MTDIQWLIGGEAGYGIMTTGVMMSKIFTRLGCSVFDYVEYPSLIRGGHNAYYVRGSDEKIYSQKHIVDILVALNSETIDKHKHELTEDAFVLFDPDTTTIKDGEFSASIQLIPVPFFKLVREIGADRLMINTLSVGASLALFSTDFQILEQILQDTFGKKGQEVVTENIRTTKAGFDFVKKEFPHARFFSFPKKHQDDLLIGGAEAVALGAIRAGLQFTAIYPMTPINGIMLTLTQHALDYGIVVKEPEDEIAGINMAIGASYAGARSMVATSGGGFALMVEALGLAAQTETPLVIIEGMRPGPATGMPTWTDQGDVRFVLHAAHGDFPRIVLAPGDPLEAFTYTMQAFNLAEKYQLPVIILVDKYLMEGHATISIKKMQEASAHFTIERGKMLTDDEVAQVDDYKRYAFVEDGISPRSTPGQKGGISLSGSDEHDERGLYNEDADVRKKMMEKRFRKLDMALAEIHPLNVYGSEDAELTLIGFGSTKLPVLDALRLLEKEGMRVNFLQIVSLSPFPSELVATVLRDAKKSVLIEANKTGQLEGIIREHTGLSVEHSMRLYDGRPFYAEDIVTFIKEII